MSAFIIVAALMAAIAATVVAVPLMRDKKNRLVGALAALLVAGAAAGLYPLWSNWDWRAPAQAQAIAAPEVAAMMAKLEQHLRDDPNDLAGWLMLGRSYTALQRLDDAVTAYDRAHRLAGNNAEAALGLGEALSLRAGGEITPPAAQLFEDAITLEPNNPKALLYGGFAAAARGDPALARSRWQALKDLHPPAQIEQMLDARIAELGAAPPAGATGTAGARGTAGAAGTGPPSGTNASPAGTSASAEGSAAAQVTVNIRIAPALKSRLKPEAPLFVFARDPGSVGPPLAAKRLTSAAIGTQVQLSAADSMMPGRVLVSGRRVSITARVSFSGQPTPAAGDLYGELGYDVGHDGALDLVIDHVAD
jgi:cytochrome c-type biogenesis protein CcmH